MNKSVKTEPQPSEDYKALQKQFESICDKMEQLYKPTFEKVFEALYKIDSNLNKNYPCTNNESDIKEAVLQAEFGSDEALCKDFIEYNRLFIEGKKIQMQGLELRAHDFAKVSQQQQEQPEGWQFYPISIIASSELLDIIKDIIKSDAENGKGLFANVTDIPLEDVDEDEFDMVEVYNCQATFTKYFAELKKYAIIGAVGGDVFLNKTFKDALMGLLKALATYIKEHTDQQATSKNEITDTIKILDKLPHWGLFLQILTLQGLCRWLESVNINEGDNGFDEAQSLYNWLWELLAEKIMRLAFMPYSDGDKARLKPLTYYLYSTEVGRQVQNSIFGDPQPQQPTNDEQKEPTEKEKPYFKKAIEAGYMQETKTGYKWTFGGDRGKKARLSYFIKKIYGDYQQIPYSRLEKLFGVSRLDSSTTQLLNAKKPQNWSTEIDKLFDN